MVREEGGPLLEEAPRLLELGVDKGGLNINQSYVVEKTSAIMGPIELCRGVEPRV
jgi:hypothetical protein